jgi:hypothetical protein
MTTQSHKLTLGLVIGLTVTAALLFAATIGVATPALQISEPPSMNGRSFQCDPGDGNYRVSFNWTQKMPGNGAWLGTVTVSQGTNIVLNGKPIQVFDAMPLNAKDKDPINRQFQAQDGSFYCSKFTVSSQQGNLRNIVDWSGCRDWVLADHLCRFPRFR